MFFFCMCFRFIITVLCDDLCVCDVFVCLFCQGRGTGWVCGRGWGGGSLCSLTLEWIFVLYNFISVPVGELVIMASPTLACDGPQEDCIDCGQVTQSPAHQVGGHSKVLVLWTKLVPVLFVAMTNQCCSSWRRKKSWGRNGWIGHYHYYASACPTAARAQWESGSPSGGAPRQLFFLYSMNQKPQRYQVVLFLSPSPSLSLSFSLCLSRFHSVSLVFTLCLSRFHSLSLSLSFSLSLCVSSSHSVAAFTYGRTSVYSTHVLYMWMTNPDVGPPQKNPPPEVVFSL